jgi:hypothetical protein
LKGEVIDDGHDIGFRIVHQAKTLGKKRKRDTENGKEGETYGAGILYGKYLESWDEEKQDLTHKGKYPISRRMKENRLDALMMPQVPYIASDDRYRWKYADIPVTERFTARSYCGRLQPGKMILQLGLGVPLRTMHHVHLRADREITTKLRVQHYITKPKKEWDWRRFVRNDVHENKYTDKDFYLYNELI